MLSKMLKSLRARAYWETLIEDMLFLSRLPSSELDALSREYGVPPQVLRALEIRIRERIGESMRTRWSVIEWVKRCVR